METPELAKALRCCASRLCTACPYSGVRCFGADDLMQQAADALEKLSVRNAQLRTVIIQNDQNFFKRKCRVCGCDWNHPCNDHDYWVEDDLCSTCASKSERSEG